MKYDAIVIGFGQGAGSLVRQMADQDWKVALIEKNEESSYGGSCVNIGCIPTKILEYDARHGKSYADAVNRRNTVVERNSQAEKERMEANKHVDLYTGIGSFIDNNKIKVVTAEDEYELEADYVFIDTGSTPVIPPITGLDETDHVYTSTTLQTKEELPQKLGIIGAGNIGLEYASIYDAFGSEVTLIDSGAQLLDGEEPEIVAEVEEVIKDKGIKLYYDTHVQKVANKDGGIIVTTEDKREFEFDTLLIATGRKPNIEGLNLDEIGIELTDKKGIKTNQHLETNIEGVFALGDVRGEEQFTYITTKDAEIIINYLFADGSKLLHDRENIPYSIFMDPPFAKVGLTEAEAEEKGYKVQTNMTPISATTRSDITDDTRGLYKAVVDGRNGHVLGVTLFGDQAHELVNFVKLAIDNELKASVFKNQMITHPVMSEIFNTLFDM